MTIKEWQVKAVVFLFTTLHLPHIFSIYKLCCRLLMTDSHQLAFQSDWILRACALLVHPSLERSHRRPIDCQFVSVLLYQHRLFPAVDFCFLTSLCLKKTLECKMLLVIVQNHSNPAINCHIFIFINNCFAHWHTKVVCLHNCSTSFVLVFAFQCNDVNCESKNSICVEWCVIGTA